MKYVVLNGYIEKNLGDDLFIRYITTKYDKIHFFMFGNSDEEYISHSLNNLKVIKLKENKILKALSHFYKSLIPNLEYIIKKHSQAVVYIGGSIFIEYENWKAISNWWEYQAKEFNFFVLGSNFGPYYSSKYKDRMNDIFYLCKDVCMRDRYSYNLFHQNSKVRYAPDILLAYRMPKREIQKKVFISVINCQKKDEGINSLKDYQKKYEIFLANTISDYINHGYSIVLSSFCEKEGDYETINNILPHLKNKDSISIINYDGYNFDNILETISSSTYIIASRFHAAILALAAKRPVLPVIYSNKTKNVLEDINFSGRILDIRQLKDNYSFDEINENVDIEQNMEEYIKQAKKHFYKFDQYLK